MSKVHLAEALVVLPTLVVYAMPVFALNRAWERHGIRKARHLVNRYFLWLIAEILVLYGISLLWESWDSSSNDYLPFLLYIVAIFAALPFYAAIAGNVVYWAYFVAARRYRHYGWDWREMTVGRNIIKK